MSTMGLSFHIRVFEHHERHVIFIVASYIRPPASAYITMLSELEEPKTGGLTHSKIISCTEVKVFVIGYIARVVLSMVQSTPHSFLSTPM